MFILTEEDHKHIGKQVLMVQHNTIEQVREHLKWMMSEVEDYSDDFTEGQLAMCLDIDLHLEAMQKVLEDKSNGLTS